MPKKTFKNLDKAKKKRIEQGAMSVINAQGYDKTTIRDVVRAVDIPRGSFYQYFGGMQDLFTHLLDVISEKKMAYMRHLWAKVHEQSFISLYPEFIKKGLAFARTHKEAYLFGYHLFHSNSEEVLNLRKKMEHESISMMESLLEEDKSRGTLKINVNTRLLAGLLYDFNTRQLIRMVYEHADEKTIMNKADEFLAIIHYGIMIEEVSHEKEGF